MSKSLEITQDIIESLEDVMGNIMIPCHPEQMYIEKDTTFKTLLIHDNHSEETYSISYKDKTVKNILIDCIKLCIKKSYGGTNKNDD